jgi:hypothetical protein
VTSYEVPDGPKMLRETLCVAQTRISDSPLDEGRKAGHIARLQRLIDECDRHRPLGPDGEHDNRHTPTCGCDDEPDHLAATDRLARATLGDPSIGMPPLDQDPTAKLLGLVADPDTVVNET